MQGASHSSHVIFLQHNMFVVPDDVKQIVVFLPLTFLSSVLQRKRSCWNHKNLLRSVLGFLIYFPRFVNFGFWKLKILRLSETVFTLQFSLFRIFEFILYGKKKIFFRGKDPCTLPVHKLLKYLLSEKNVLTNREKYFDDKYSQMSENFKREQKS